MPAASKPGGLLLVDDADNDRLLFRIAFQQAGLRSLRLLTSLTHGAEAIDYLAGQDKFTDRSLFPYPDLMVLDLKMPFKSGFDVLEWLRTQATSPVVVILSDSSDKADKDRARSLGAAQYFVKPQGLPELVALMRDLEKLYKASVPSRLSSTASVPRRRAASRPR